MNHTFPRPQADQVSAFAHLAHSESRNAVVYSQWAKEARQAGRVALAERWEAISANLRRDALWAIGKARDRKAFRIGREHQEQEQDV